MAKILITGGSGLLGREISDQLIQLGHEPRWLGRSKNQVPNIPTFTWDVSKKTIDISAFEEVDALIHLAGAGIVDKRWTASYKKELLDSRVKSSELLYETIARNNISLKTLVGGSAIGYYNSYAIESCDENSAPGTDFMARTCVAWENSYSPFAENGIRTVIIRTGIVLSKKGGAYAKMVPPFKFGLGAAIGSGEQAFPWIHVKDVAGIFVYALLNTNMKGVYNAVSSRPVTNLEFSKRLAKSLHKPFFLPAVPEFVLQLVLGERAVTVTKGASVSNDKIKQSGFRFAFDNLDEALTDLI